VTWSTLLAGLTKPILGICFTIRFIVLEQKMFKSKHPFILYKKRDFAIDFLFHRRLEKPSSLLVKHILCIWLGYDAPLFAPSINYNDSKKDESDGI
jgi:hypothetical protein